METIEKMSNGLFNSAGFKLALITFLTLLLLIPANMIMNLIREREERRDETIKEVTTVWGNEQTLCGPILTIPYKVTEKTGQNEYKTVIMHAHFLPDNFNVEGNVEPEVRYRGIYKAVTYHTQLHITGQFTGADLASLNVKPEQIDGDKAWIEIGIPDMRGINKEIVLHWGDTVLPVIPGIPSQELSTSGIHSEVPVTDPADINFAFDLDLNGSYSLNFIPVGKETNVRLTSAWNSPSFNGAFLPDDRKITKSGFTANWNILQLNRNYPQQWTGNQYSLGESAFGVDLITPVDTYQKSMRSVKYALLFIGLTFLVLFFSEVLTNTRIHPVNYLLTGIALCIFYSLLTALAEHISFALAYLISSLTILAMIAIFAHSLYRNRKVTLTVVGVLVALYTFLYVILQLMDYSLLFGNIGLVIILGLVMYFSRKINWYSTVRSTDEGKK
jgi:inner membrane protein